MQKAPPDSGGAFACPLQNKINGLFFNFSPQHGFGAWQTILIHIGCFSTSDIGAPHFKKPIIPLFLGLFHNKTATWKPY
jgi:hypothetical protein